MRTLADFLRITPDLVAEDTEWLHLLVEDWQMLADLADWPRVELRTDAAAV